MKTFLSLLLVLLTASAVAQPSIPTNAVITRVTNSNVSLAWDRAVSHTNIAAFVLYVGSKSGVYNTNFFVSPSNTTFTVSNLSGSVFFFVVTAKSTNGLESDYSNEINFDLRKPEPPAGLRTIGAALWLKSSDNPDGPWRPDVYFGTIHYAMADRRFFRAEVVMMR